MSAAFVFIQVNSGDAERVAKQLKGIDNIEEVYLLHGAYDLVVKVEASSMSQVRDTIAWQIRHSKGVKSTLTTIVAEEIMPILA